MSEKTPNFPSEKTHIERSLTDEGITNKKNWRESLGESEDEKEWTKRLILSGVAQNAEAAKNIQQEACNQLYHALNTDLNRAINLVHRSEIRPPLDQLQRIIKHSFIKNISHGNASHAFRIINHPSFSPDDSFYNSISIRAAVSKTLDKSLEDLDIDTFKMISQNPRLSPDKDCLKRKPIQDILADTIYSRISERNFVALDKARNYFGDVVNTILQNETEVQHAIGNAIFVAYCDKSEETEMENLKKAGLTVENQTLHDTQEFYFITCLTHGDPREAGRHADFQNSIPSHSIQDLYRNALVKQFERGDIDGINYIINEPAFKTSKETINEAIEIGVINSFQETPAPINTLPQYIKLLFENIETKKAESIVDRGLIGYIKTNPTSKKDFSVLLAKLNYTPSNNFYKTNDLKDAIKKNIQMRISCMPESISESASEEDNKVVEAGINDIGDNLGNLQYYWQDKGELFDDDREKLSSDTLDDYEDDYTNNGFYDDSDYDDHLYGGQDDEQETDDLEIVITLLSIINSQKLSDVIPELTDKKNKIIKLLETNGSITKNEAESFSKVIDTSLSAQLFVYQENVEKIVQTIKETPFLLRALSNNESFGMKLLSAFDRFDKTSKEKISTLFKYQDEILEEEPDTQKDSVDFRLAMQNKLKEYDNNPGTLKEIALFGIDVEAWLDHDETVEFMLGGDGLEEKNPISKMIEKPFDRIIMKTIPEFFKIIKEEIAAYADDLKKIRIVDRIKKKEMEDKLSRMKELFESENDLNKKNGIQKGIISLESALKNLKTIAYSDKYNGAVSGIFNIIDKYKPKTKKEPEKQDSEEIGFIEQIRQCENAGDFQKANQLKKLFHSDHRLLVSRFDSFQKEFNEVIKTHLGGHGEAILQSVHHRTAELVSHLETDNRDLGKALEDQTLDEKLKQIKSVSLELWNRNPDIDLYLGNYSPCCISIEGGAGWDRTESAIADFMTDLSIQVLNLRDKNKNIPIMSAWLYLGKSGDGKTSSLVIDNIESDSNETSLHEVEIWNEVAAYVIKYAHRIGVDKVTMGESNNDVAPYLITHDNQTYEKIGHSNGERANGYYLESEDEDVLLIWNNDRSESPDLREEAFKLYGLPDDGIKDNYIQADMGGGY